MRCPVRQWEQLREGQKGQGRASAPNLVPRLARERPSRVGQEGWPSHHWKGRVGGKGKEAPPLHNSQLNGAIAFAPDSSRLGEGSGMRWRGKGEDQTLDLHLASNHQMGKAGNCQGRGRRQERDPR